MNGVSSPKYGRRATCSGSVMNAARDERDEELRMLRFWP
jgi:hypothetical protein